MSIDCQSTAALDTAIEVDRPPLDGVHVVLASAQKSWGGGEVYLMTLAAGLAAHGCRVSLIAPPASAIAQRAPSAIPGITVLESNCRDPWAHWQLRRWLKRNHATILHCNDSKALTRIGLAGLGNSGLHVVSMRHTMFPLRSPAKYHHLSDCTICVSHAVAADCIDRGLSPGHIRVIHAAIKPPQVDAAQIAQLRSELLDCENQPLVVAVGNLFVCKGHSSLVQAAALMRERGSSALTVIAGEGDQRAPLTQQIRSLGLTDRVRLLGFRRDANTLLAAADVIAHPSHDEGLCLTVAAGMMLKKPIVATAAGGLNEVLGIDPRIGGRGPFARVVPAGDANAMADAIINQLESPINGAGLEAARTFALEHFTPGPMVDRTLGLYSQLCQPRAVLLR